MVNVNVNDEVGCWIMIIYKLVLLHALSHSLLLRASVVLRLSVCTQRSLLLLRSSLRDESVRGCAPSVPVITRIRDEASQRFEVPASPLSRPVRAVEREILCTTLHIVQGTSLARALCDHSALRGWTSRALSRHTGLSVCTSPRPGQKLRGRVLYRRCAASSFSQ